jgi:hypothetical protein
MNNLQKAFKEKMKRGLRQTPQVRMPQPPHVQRGFMPHMADGGTVPETTDQIIARMAAKYGTTGAAQAAPAPVPVAPRPAAVTPTPQPQFGGLLGGLQRAVQEHMKQLNGAGMANGGVVPGMIRDGNSFSQDLSIYQPIVHPVAAAPLPGQQPVAPQPLPSQPVQPAAPQPAAPQPAAPEPAAPEPPVGMQGLTNSSNPGVSYQLTGRKFSSLGAGLATQTAEGLRSGMSSNDNAAVAADNQRIQMTHGGDIPGRGSGDHVPIMAEPGEVMIPKAAVKPLFGSHENAANMIERATGVPPRRGLHAGEGYDVGGVWKWGKNAVTNAWNGAGDLASSGLKGIKSWGLPANPPGGVPVNGGATASPEAATATEGVYTPSNEPRINGAPPEDTPAYQRKYTPNEFMQAAKTNPADAGVYHNAAGDSAEIRGATPEQAEPMRAGAAQGYKNAKAVPPDVKLDPVSESRPQMTLPDTPDSGSFDYKKFNKALPGLKASIAGAALNAASHADAYGRNSTLGLGDQLQLAARDALDSAGGTAGAWLGAQIGGRLAGTTGPVARIAGATTGGLYGGYKGVQGAEWLGDKLRGGANAVNSALGGDPNYWKNTDDLIAADNAKRYPNGVPHGTIQGATNAVTNAVQKAGQSVYGTNTPELSESAKNNPIAPVSAYADPAAPSSAGDSAAFALEKQLPQMTDPQARVETIDKAQGLRGTGITASRDPRTGVTTFSGNGADNQRTYIGADGQPTQNWEDTEEYQSGMQRAAALKAHAAGLPDDLEARQMQEGTRGLGGGVSAGAGYDAPEWSGPGASSRRAGIAAGVDEIINRRQANKAAERGLKAQEIQSQHELGMAGVQAQRYAADLGLQGHKLSNKYAMLNFNRELAQKNEDNQLSKLKDYTTELDKDGKPVQGGLKYSQARRNIEDTLAHVGVDLKSVDPALMSDLYSENDIKDALDSKNSEMLTQIMHRVLSDKYGTSTNLMDYRAKATHPGIISDDTTMGVAGRQLNKNIYGGGGLLVPGPVDYFRKAQVQRQLTAEERRQAGIGR